MEYSKSYFGDDFNVGHNRILLDGTYKMYHNYHISGAPSTELDHLNAVQPFVIGNILYRTQNGLWRIIITAIRMTYRELPQKVRVIDYEKGTFSYKGKIINIWEQFPEPYNCVKYSREGYSQDDMDDEDFEKYDECTTIASQLTENCIILATPHHDDARGYTYAITITDSKTGVLDAFILYN